jgi:flagellar biosynthesis/type III secretory pathway chaperone
MKTKNELTTILEETLVKQFRKLQSLILISREERKALVHGDSKSLQKQIEQKESILDDISLLEDTRRMTVGLLGQILSLPEEQSSLIDLTKKLEPSIAERLKHLYDGISKLVDEAREINMGNQALAKARSDMFMATQAFLLSFYQPPASYQPVGRPVPVQISPISDFDHRA